MSSRSRVVGLLMVIAVAGGAFLWWRYLRPTLPRDSVSVAPAVVPPVPAATLEAPAAAPSRAPPIRYPVPSVLEPTRSALPSLDHADAYVKSALIDLLGRKSVFSFLRLDGIIRRFVATVDNLGTDNATASMWPVNPTGGSLETEGKDGGTVISAKNADRYAAFVRLVAGIDTPRAVSLYRRLYPLFQTAYQDLGYPNRYFNDRVVEVIDNLLATPMPAEPIKVKRLVVDGAIVGDGRLYIFDDPALEASSAGQKILLRMGPQNAGILMATLADVRRRLVTSAGPRLGEPPIAKGDPKNDR
jgi:hypothetical protein